MYTSSLVWGDCCADLFQKYQEYSTLDECTEARIGPDGCLGLFARLDLPATCLLERYVGEIVDEADMGERNDLHVFLYDYGASKMYVDANKAGSLTRFMRKVESNIAAAAAASATGDGAASTTAPKTPLKPNCCIIPINLDGEWQLFVELKCDIKTGEELVLERYFGYHNEDSKWSGGVLDAKFPNTINQGGMTVDDENYRALMHYNKVSSLVYDRLPDEHHFLAAKRCLSDWVELRTVQDKSLPYCGQIGVYSTCPIRAGTYIGEYAGQVFVCDGTSDSLYVAKFENSFEVRHASVVV